MSAPESLPISDRCDDLEQQVSDYEEVLKSKRENIRAIDVALHGEEGAAKQASACDLIEPARKLRADVERLTRERDRAIADFSCQNRNLITAHNEQVERRVAAERLANRYKALAEGERATIAERLESIGERYSAGVVRTMPPPALDGAEKEEG